MQHTGRTKAGKKKIESGAPPPTIPSRSFKRLAENSMPVDGGSFQKCLNFIHDCALDAQRDPSSDGAFYIEELLKQLTNVCAEMVYNGNVPLGRLFPVIRKVVDEAIKRYGKTVAYSDKPKWCRDEEGNLQLNPARAKRSGSINAFLALLYQGWFWNNGTHTPCRKLADALKGADKTTATKLIMRFLKDQCGTYPTDSQTITHADGTQVSQTYCKIDVFDPMLKKRTSKRKDLKGNTLKLIQGNNGEQWKAIEDEIERAIETMHERLHGCPVSPIVDLERSIEDAIKSKPGS